jgi:ABC-type glycerol-3-phosphate transport system substrate-binding protein
MWIWNWSTVYDFADIITSFLVWNWTYDISKWENIKEAFTSYMLFWDEKWYNWYNIKLQDMKSTWEKNIDLFSKWDVISIMWYPRMLEQIDLKWFSNPNRLLAIKMPLFWTKNEKVFINYNYFVVSKNTSNPDLAYSFMQYLTKDDWAKKYLKKYPYYLPALLSLEATELDKNVSSWYNVKLRDFFIDDGRELSSFNKGLKSIYDKEIVSVFDDQNNYSALFDTFKNTLLCKTRKITTLENLSDDCSK